MYFLLSLFLFSTVAHAENLDGVLLEKGTKRPLAAVNVFVLPAKLKATTGDDGRFSIEGAPAGSASLVVNAAGYKKLEKTVTLPLSAPLRLFLERETYHGLEATVVGKVAKRDDSSRAMRREEFLTLPGSSGDPVKAVQNLPGVSRVSGFSSQVVIQGSAPQDTAYMIDGHQVPLVFHFGGLSSVITPEAVDRVDYLSAGYGPEYGRAMGGQVGLVTRDPESDQSKGFVFADTAKAGGLVEGRVGERGSYLLTGRVSYIGQVLRTVLRNNSSFDLTVVPSFSDLAGVYKRKLSETDSLRVFSIFSHDELGFLFKEPNRTDPGIRGSFSNQTTFYRIIPQWTRRWDVDHALTISFGAGQDLIHVDIGDNYFDLNSTTVSQRAEWESTPAANWKSYLGLDSSYSRATAKFKLPVMSGVGGVRNPVAGSQVVDANVTTDIVEIAPYWRGQFRAPESKLTWLPGFRADYLSLTKEVLPGPRLAARYEWDESLKLNASSGIYYQSPEPQETSPAYGNPDIKSPYAIHYVAGFEKDLRESRVDGWIFSTNLFYKNFQRLVVRSSKFVERDMQLVAENYNNEGRGRAYGSEFMIKYEGKPFSGWLAYTLSRSLRNEPGFDEHAFQYDQTHNVNLVAQYESSNNWKYSSRVRYVTGNPTTPVIGASFDADNDVYVPVRGPLYSSRLEPFFQVDLRVDKKWVYDTWILWAYLDIQNLTNNKNSEAVRYSYDYSQSQSVTGLPVFPTLGVKGEF